jgi:2-polyprenyl-3-methyl-5-hydroxy-6-metoxy-1,4-benzoquinol methylase
MELIPTWLNKNLDKNRMTEFNYQIINGILVQGKLVEERKTLWSNSEFRSRSEERFTTSWAEQQLAEQLLNNSLQSIDGLEERVFVDLGCGDGRFVRNLLQRGVKKIVALNYEIEPLESLLSTLTTEEKACVAVICADVNEHPFHEQSFDFAIAWGLLSVTENFDQSLATTASLMKLNGLLLSADPILEQYLAYALVKQDTEEFKKILETRTRPSSWQNRELNRYHLLTLMELNHKMQVPYLDLLWKEGVGTFPSLLFGGIFDEVHKDPSELESIWDVLFRHSGDLSWYRQMVYLMRRTS